jgi:hypothetical protein
MPPPADDPAQKQWDDEQLLREVERIAAQVRAIDELTALVPRLRGQVREAERRLKEARWTLQTLLRRQALRVVQGYLPLPKLSEVNGLQSGASPPAAPEASPASTGKRRRRGKRGGNTPEETKHE